MMPRTLFAVLVAIAVSTPAARAATTVDGQEEICASSAVIICDNFENRAPGSGDLGRAIYKNPGWGVSSGGGMSVSTSDKFDGSKSLEFRYPSGSWSSNQDEGAGTGYMAVDFGGRPEIFLRHYVKWGSNWVWSPVATKHIAMLTSAGARAPWAWHGTSGSALLHHIYEPTQTMYDQNVGSAVAVRAGQWYCLELHLKMNSPGSAVIESWVDNNLKWSDTRATFGSQGTTWNSIMLSGYWNAPGSHPAMSRWFDNIVVSTQRIGCMGTPPPAAPNAPPAAPTGVTLR
jgi:hypothetical protein